MLEAWIFPLSLLNLDIACFRSTWGRVSKLTIPAANAVSRRFMIPPVACAVSDVSFTIKFAVLPFICTFFPMRPNIPLPMWRITVIPLCRAWRYNIFNIAGFRSTWGRIAKHIISAANAVSRYFMTPSVACAISDASLTIKSAILSFICTFSPMGPHIPLPVRHITVIPFCRAWRNNVLKITGFHSTWGWIAKRIISAVNSPCHHFLRPSFTFSIAHYFCSWNRTELVLRCTRYPPIGKSRIG